MKSKLRLPYRLFLVTLLFLVGFILAALVFPVLNLSFSATKAKNARDAIKQYWLRAFAAILNLQVTLEGHLPGRTAILASNHISWLDIIVIGQYLPAYFVAKSDISRWPVIGYLSRQAGTVFIRRGDKKHILETAENMVWLLKQNSNIIAFPEGTTTNGEEVLGFHASLFQPALLTKAIVQPLAIQYQGVARVEAPFIGDDSFVPHLIKMLLLDKIEVKLSFLPIINSSGKSRQSVSTETREMILNQISNSSLMAICENSA